MKGHSWLLVPLALAAAACGDVTTPATPAPEHAAPRAVEGSGYDIVAQSFIPDNETCGHYATYDGMAVSSIDWAVNGSLVAQDVSGIDYQNDGSPYTVAVGDWNGSSFTTYYSETFYPVQSDAACLSLGL